jgi:hypothetical protein
MDRRYREARFGGVRASNSRQQRSDGLVRQYLGRARRENHAAQSYGGSTGGASSANPGLGAENLGKRSAEMGASRQVFREAGSGALGARRSFGQARQLPELP